MYTGIFGKEGDFVDKKPVMLIVDDVEINRVVLSQFFRQEYTVVEAASGQDALKIIENRPVHIVLVDLAMPKMDGLDLLAAVKRDSRYAHIPVIVMTARSDDYGEARAIEMGAADFIVKPYNMTVVRRRVQNVMALQENTWRREEQAARNQQLIEMHHCVETDALTGLYNRETFYRRAAALLQENRGTAYDMIFFDISGFKAVNDLFRMDTGNLVLKTAAVYFRVLAGDDGLCGRIEADHFTLCLPKSRVDMDTILNGLDNIVKPLSSSHDITFYAGVYPVDNVLLPIDQMCARAQMALNHIKGSYALRYACYDDGMRDQMAEEQMIVRDMDFALQEGQFCIYLQPVCNLHTDAIVSAEALVRWKHPQHGLILPDKFIPVLERNGFIARLDRFVWEAACRFLKKQQDSGRPVIPVSVNVSRLDFYSLDLLDFLLGLLEKYGLAPWMLRLEITERAYADNPHQLSKVVHTFREKGFAVIMDNFGRGSSSLSMLKNLPVDMLKLDAAFVQEAERSERAGIVLESLVAMAGKLGMEVAVEGVETKPQVDCLAARGCELVQGYYYSRPLPEDEFAGLLMRSWQEGAAQ